MGSTRQVYSTGSTPDFLQSVLQHDSISTTLIVCSTRDQFLTRLLAATHPTRGEVAGRHHIYGKTIGLLSRSSRVRVLFCPTLENLRACLSVVGSQRIPQDEKESHEQTEARPLLAVLDSLSLHAPTTEFSAQGLSRTFAALAETSFRADMDLVLCECQDSTNHEVSPWNAQVPMLNSTVRVSEETALFRRTVPVKRVAERWFEFIEKDYAIAGTVDDARANAQKHTEIEEDRDFQ
ncbi:uncharacterized protein BO66DRAFT_99934 [Aspergillus aculeatinus CBS 121060]|uniref:Uncharacterized protein n=1 Tax=Aspergillus aculeatinus CBS 121060 TaxID=1448322 RepID=A0ACD1H7Y5_9EURO|nr:hypothetical protein BO66DRAFT_99934 [Aspergillus aculeatinus CBS 121060]RAH69667.1 hypothetical protein BO66DRAFT_99934 [Aspergillus aculeatinus CBS 121060]